MGSRQAKKLDASALWEYALRALGARAHAISDLRQKLRRRAAQAGDVDQVLSRLKTYGYVDDRRFAANYAASRLQNQGFGRGRVLRDLRARRVAPALAEQAVRDAYRGADEVDLIGSFLERKYRRISLPSYLSEPKNLAAVYRKLRLAGFSSGNVLRVLKRYAAEADGLDALEMPEEEAGEQQ